jgi:hypothetical protein
MVSNTAVLLLSVGCLLTMPALALALRDLPARPCAGSGLQVTPIGAIGLAAAMEEQQATHGPHAGWGKQANPSVQAALAGLRVMSDPFPSARRGLSGGVRRRRTSFAWRSQTDRSRRETLLRVEVVEVRRSPLSKQERPCGVAPTDPLPVARPCARIRSEAHQPWSAPRISPIVAVGWIRRTQSTTSPSVHHLRPLAT